MNPLPRAADASLSDAAVLDRHGWHDLGNAGLMACGKAIPLLRPGPAQGGSASAG